ncbi:MAG TPA: ATP-binding cassette domain-containing protein, partial [Alphaproteobacteria bacterium]|nr:ATP-binding cassette domain-containing protein [Alphaproteobacteria bacterium]
MAETVTNSPLLDVRNLRIEAVAETGKRLTLVDDVSFSLNGGEVLGLIGESGAGKSTIGLSALIYARTGCQITGGQIIFRGHELRELGIEARQSLRGAKVA